MRRCPQCQYACPDSAHFCPQCGLPLAPLPRTAWITPADVWSPAACGRAVLALLPVLAFRLTFGGWLVVGMERVEGRFLAFHLLHGLLLGAGLAWARRERAGGWALWLAAGLAGGLMAEALEVWYMYRHLMGMLTQAAFQWFNWPQTPALIYEMLQGLRLAGAVFPLLLLYSQREPRPARVLLACLLGLAAVAARTQMRDAWLAWGTLPGLEGWKFLLLYAFSALILFYGMGRGTLDGDGRG